MTTIPLCFVRNCTFIPLYFIRNTTIIPLYFITHLVYVIEKQLFGSRVIY